MQAYAQLGNNVKVVIVLHNGYRPFTTVTHILSRFMTMGHKLTSLFFEGTDSSYDWNGASLEW